MLMVSGRVFAWLIFERDGASYIDTINSVLFQPRDLESKAQKASVKTEPEQLYNIEVDAAVTHSAAGSYNDITVNSGGVTLKNKTVLGDLIISPKVGNGEVVLENIVVRGNITVKGAGKLVFRDVTAVDVNADYNKTTDYILEGKTTVYQLNVNGAATIDESGLANGYYGIKRVSAENRELLKKVTLKAGTVEQTVKKGK
jgi:hypothetical protein